MNKLAAFRFSRPAHINDNLCVALKNGAVYDTLLSSGGLSKLVTLHCYSAAVHFKTGIDKKKRGGVRWNLRTIFLKKRTEKHRENSVNRKKAIKHGSVKIKFGENRSTRVIYPLV